GNSSAHVSVAHTVSTTAPSVSITQSSQTTLPGQSFTVTWSAHNVASCTLQKTDPNNMTSYKYPQTSGVCGDSGSTATNVGLSGNCSATPAIVGVHHWVINCMDSNGVVVIQGFVDHQVKSVLSFRSSQSFLAQTASALTGFGSTIQLLENFFSHL
ncbi:MAG TPA: hypothetical protein VN495_00805, partial [Candidatus Paceibacterota bacterium]|nr:hypothetical protein [Candidatus Paceibacterota bacterium]